MIYEDKFLKILELYKLAYQGIHSKEFKQGIGEKVYGLKMYKASEDNNDFLDIESEEFGFCLNINGMTKFSTTVTREEALTDTYSVEVLLNNIIEVLESKGAIVLNPLRWRFPSGVPVRIEVPGGSYAQAQKPEVDLANYGYHKGKSEAFDTLMQKKNITLVE